MPTGVLLVNLGTPDSPRTSDVRRYLREFLHDPYVIDISTVARWLLVEGAILPFRPRVSARAYASIWLEEGSPLLVHGRALRDALAKALGDPFRVALGMRYGSPSIESGLRELAGTDRVVVAPLFPQYATSSTETAVEAVRRAAGGMRLRILGPFYDDPGFIAAWTEVAKPELEQFRADHVLLSFHGLPERQIRKLDASGRHCLESDCCCDAIVAANRSCYRAQCFATARALARALALPDDRYSVSFQSRLGRTPWIRPYTDERLAELAASGVRRLAVLCPAFVADCLETLEEIGIRGREQWREAGGEALHLVPCPNAHPHWVEALAARIRDALGGPESDRPAQD
jgi:ferrochelatase